MRYKHWFFIPENDRLRGLERIQEYKTKHNSTDVKIYYTLKGLTSGLFDLVVYVECFQHKNDIDLIYLNNLQRLPRKPTDNNLTLITFTLDEFIEFAKKQIKIWIKY